MNPLKVIGCLPDGRPIVGGAFALADSHGITLGDAMQIALTKNAGVSLLDYCADALIAGWPLERVMTKTREALADNGYAADAIDAALLRLRQAVQGMARQGDQCLVEAGKRMRAAVMCGCN